MKKSVFTSILALLFAGWGTIMAGQWPKEYLGRPGDNLNLYAVMDLFQESRTLEGFERSLNDMDSRINNLDLNGDNMVDYIMVSDYIDRDVHNIVLRVALDRNETQDVAVFTVQKFRNGSVQIQLIGDEALYGRNYIIEPIYADTYSYGYSRKDLRKARRHMVLTSYYEVANWPIIRSIYRPDYMVWHTEWDWGYWPVWWYGWTPWSWHFYYGYHHNMFPYYYAHYHPWDHFRYTRYDDFYFRNIRHHSPFMAERMNEGRFNSTYGRPEQRREGEKFYSRVHSSQNPGMRDNPAMDNQGRRPAPDQSVREQVPAPERRNSSPATVKRPEPSRSSSQPARVQRTEPSRPSGQPETVERSEPARPSRQPATVQRTEPSRPSSQPATRVSVPAPDSRRTGSTGQAVPQGRTASEKSSTSREPGNVYASRR
jgi:hypothetical protein